jgi:hypothetical protein
MPKNSRKAPLLSELEEYSHVISAVDMFSDSPTNDEVTVIEPASIDDIPIAIVAAAMNKISCTVD